MYGERALPESRDYVIVATVNVLDYPSLEVGELLIDNYPSILQRPEGGARLKRRRGLASRWIAARTDARLVGSEELHNARGWIYLDPLLQCTFMACVLRWARVKAGAADWAGRELDASQGVAWIKAGQNVLMDSVSGMTSRI